MEVGHWLNTVGAQSRGKEENPEYGVRELLTAAREIVWS